MRAGVILYGPPASGKDTVDAALRQRSPAYRHFARLKVGPGRTQGYRMTTDTDLDVLRQAGHVVWENHRYDATYAIDAPGLADALIGGIPIVHLGQPEAIAAVREATPETRWVVVALTTSRDVAIHRLAQRNPADVPERLAAWDETPPLDGADMRIDTGNVSPDEAALQIDAAAPSC